jgi:hypothetical protein
MKSILTFIGSIVLATALFCTVAVAQKTSVGFDQNANFSTYKTFAFDKTEARNPYVSGMIVAAVERELTARGLTRVEANPDLLVVYLAATGYDPQVASVPFYTTVNPAYSGVIAGASSTGAWVVTTGTLLIDLVDVKANKTVFRGTAREVLQRAPTANAAADAKLVSKPINKGVAKIFKKYPVKAK